MTNRRTQLQEDTFFRIMQILENETDITQREIAKKLGLSTSGINYCLQALIDKGLVKMENFSQSKNKFGYIYVLTPQGISEKIRITALFLKRKMAEYTAIREEIEQITKNSLIRKSLDELTNSKHQIRRGSAKDGNSSISGISERK